MYIIMLGAPGTGKGTIGKILSKDLGLKYLSTGDVFREQIRRKTEFGLEAEKYISKGLLVPDDITIQIVTDYLLENNEVKGIILDGFPRTVKQAQTLKDFLEKHNINQKILAIELNVPDEEVIKRIVSRVICSNKDCGQIYNLETRRPKQDGICDICGSKLTKREDDNEKTVKERLKVYHASSKELIKFYKENNQIYSIYPKHSEQAVEMIKKYIYNM